MTKLENLFTVTDHFRALRGKSFSKVAKDPHLFPEVLSELEILKRTVYPERKKIASQLIQEHPDKLRLSCFELMEHDFRENTHSNIHQYIFDYHFLGKYGPLMLANFIDDGECTIPGIRDKLNERKYKIFREKTAGTGRVDLMIVDEDHKFIIIVENKVLADIAVRNSTELAEKRTQLSDYWSYVTKHYPAYDKDFILLTFLNVAEDYFPYRHKTYKQLFEVIERTDCNDIVVQQYRMLLNSLLHGVADKHKRAKDAISVLEDEYELNLNNLELLKLLF